MSVHGEGFETFSQVGQTVAGCIQIRVIDLFRISGKDHFCSFAGAADNGFDLMGCQILGFIHNDELPGNASAADVCQGFQFQFPAPAQFFNFFADQSFLIGFARVHQIFQIVKNGLHPDTEFFILVPGQIPDVIPHGDHRAGNQDPFIDRIFDDLLQRGRHCQKGFAGTGLSHQRNHLYIRIHQKSKRHTLFFAAGV